MFMANHCSGDTKESFIADVFVSLAMGQIKTPAPCKSEMLVKYNHFFHVEEDMGTMLSTWVRTSSTLDGSRR